VAPVKKLAGLLVRNLVKLVNLVEGRDRVPHPFLCLLGEDPHPRRLLQGDDDGVAVAPHALCLQEGGVGARRKDQARQLDQSGVGTLPGTRNVGYL
jgi:hypothetical protein